ncbi:MAG: hypothetical protein HZB99_00980 [Candidatus Harrisonbacteria bacterium]|nr:hypothetical protein [Candidatus Harrisonbacteria bacterium]
MVSSDKCPLGVPCDITLNSDQSVSANFIKGIYLEVTKRGLGTGTVTGQSINCGNTCSKTYNFGESEVLTAKPDIGSKFVGWGGACASAGINLTCLVKMEGAPRKAVTAEFVPIGSFRLNTVVLGSGTIRGGGYYIEGTNVILTAAPVSGGVFNGWEDDNCRLFGKGNCTIRMNSDKLVIGRFSELPLLTVAKGNNGKGIISVIGTDISCDANCPELSHNFDLDTPVNLRAGEDTSSTFTGWSGQNAGECGPDLKSRDCGPITMDKAKSLTANFTLKPMTLTVIKPAVGRVQTTQILPSLYCSSSSTAQDCTKTYNYGDKIVLQALPDSNYSFVSWGDDCQGQVGDCVITINKPLTVSANFIAKTTIQINIEGVQDKSRGAERGRVTE